MIPLPSHASLQRFLTSSLLWRLLICCGLLLQGTPAGAQQAGYGATGRPTGTDLQRGLQVPGAAGAFQGSVPAAPATPGVLSLSFAQAVEMGLANNLGILLAREGSRASRGERWVELSRLLPNLSVSATAHHLRENLAITGISLPNAPTVVGPFNYYDARIFLTQRVLDLNALKRSQAARHELQAAEHSEQDARELVVLAVGASYLQVLSDSARVETVQSQLATASTMLNNAEEMHLAGVTPGIDELRARVEWLNRSQQLIVAENDLAKQKLSLLRLIGLPVGQQIVLADQAPFQQVIAGTLADHLATALEVREDYRAAQSLVKAARSARQAAGAQRLPVLVLDADYGSTGRTLSNVRETYHIVGSLQVPIFEGGRIHGEVLRAEAQLRQREEELADLRGRIEFELRSALLDLSAAAREVEVTRSTAQLADITLYQAQERFSAGIDDNLAVVQAQQSVAAAHEGLVSSQYRLNLARLLLARAMGIAERSAASTGGR